MSYQGRDRRRHKVFITRNTEYHFRDEICVAVRDRQAKRFRAAHIALHLKLQGAVKIGQNGGAMPDSDGPRVGAAIYFTRDDDAVGEHQIVTSRVERIERPAKQDVLQYPQPRLQKPS
jgi:hypothetical protein